LLLAWQPGQEAGHAIAAVLAGAVNPSGKLPVTFPVALDDAPAMQGYPGTVLEPGTSTAPPPFGGAKAAEVTYSEGLAVGYRHFQTRATRVSFPFGYGLSYTTFAYGPLQVQPGSTPERWTATVEVRNAGKVAGSEVVQLYVSAPKAEQPQPAIELRRFAKTRRLEPGEAETVSFEVGPRELASFDADGAAWVARTGEYTLSAAASAADLRRSKKLRLERELRVPLEPAAR
jgi:beta-glucosidase